MLLINDKKFKIIKKEVKFVDSKYNKKQGYSLLVTINFDFLNKKSENPGYISFYMEFLDARNIKYFENKKYDVYPDGFDIRLDMIEIYDLNNFIDFIDSNILVEFGSIKENEIKMKLNINDKLIKIEFDDFMDINLK